MSAPAPSTPTTLHAFVAAAADCIDAVELFTAVQVLVEDSLLRPLRVEHGRLRASVLHGAAQAEASMTACLAVPPLSPWVNTNGVASMLRFALDVYCGQGPPEQLGRLEEQLKQLALVEQAQVLAKAAAAGGGLGSSSPPDEVAIACAAVLQAVLACAAAAFGGQALYTSVLHGREVLAAVRRDFLSSPSTLAADPPSTAALLALLRQVDDATTGTQRLVGEASAALADWFAQGHHKEQELLDLDQWYLCCISASEEWAREEHRREVAQSSLAQRVAHLQRELDLAVDEENLERLEFDRRCGKFLPRAGVPRAFEAMAPIVIRPLSTDYAHPHHGQRH